MNHPARLRAAVTSVVALLLSACASEPVAVASDRPKTVVCTLEAPTASNIRVTRCHEVQDVEVRTAIDRETAERIPNQPFRMPP